MTVQNQGQYQNQPHYQAQGQAQPRIPAQSAQPPAGVEPAAAPPYQPPAPAPAPKPPVAALTGLTLLAGLGAWLLAAPFLLGEQARAVPWTTATRVDVGTGAALTLVALTGLLGYLGAAVGWRARYGRR